MQFMVITYKQEDGNEGVNFMARMFNKGWETLKPLKYYKCCGHYCTTLFLTDNL